MNSLENKSEIDLMGLFEEVLKEKKLVILITSLISIISIFFALSLQNTYTSKTILTPTSQEESLSSKLSSLSPFNSFAGFGLSPEYLSKGQEGIERIQSFEFFSKYFLPNINLENLMAVKKWDADTNSIIYDSDKFLIESKEWIKKSNKGKNKVPSAQDAFIKYKRILNVTVDKKTSLYTISIDHYSPFIAQQWTMMIVNQINKNMRESDADQAQKYIDYLEEKSVSTNIQSLRESIALLLESQIKTLMLTAANEDYVFKIMDSPIVPEKKSKPSRALICVLGAFLGFIFSLIVVLIKYLYYQYKHKGEN